MNVLIRGIPNFDYTQTLQVESADAFAAVYDLRVRVDYLHDARGEYFDPKHGKRVSLYVEGTLDNEGFVMRRCYDPGRMSMRCMTITVNNEGAVKTAGTSSVLRLGTGEWYMIDPKLDPRYMKLRAQAVREFTAHQRRLAAQQAQEDALREEIDDIIDARGAATVLKILREAKPS